MNRCKDCRFLGDEIETWCWKSGKGEPQNTGIYVCRAIEHASDGCDAASGKKRVAHVVDGSDYFAALRVPADFGCVYWEKKQ